MKTGTAIREGREQGLMETDEVLTVDEVGAYLKVAGAAVRR
jgi:hypothetical protein